MNDMAPKAICPGCGEPVKPSWRICPACETRLQALACPACKAEVKETWRRCPECEAALVCQECGRRLTAGETSCPQCGPPKTMLEAGSSIFIDPVCGMEFIPIPGGKYLMGDTLGEGIENEKPVHEVILDDFFIGKFPVTRTQWERLMEGNSEGAESPENPVAQITWDMASEFARKLTKAVKGKATFMLPTEAQWEYAARAGGRDELYAGGPDIDAVAWYETNSGGKSHPVGRKKSNALGLYDMSGNVWEWCLDTFREDAYRHHAGRNPVISDAGPDRVIRGGGWNLDAWSARCTRRSSLRFDFSGPALGFRVSAAFRRSDGISSAVRRR